MYRKILRSAVYPQSQPKTYRMSCVGKWNWCAEQSRHVALGLIPEEVADIPEIGTIGHKVLEESMGKRFPWENDFLDELAKFQDPQLGFVRALEGAKLYANITGHMDDLQVTIDRTVSVVEHKFVLNPNLWFIQRYKFPMAELQTRGYAWILDPIVEQLGGGMNRYHAVCYWNLNTFAHIHTFQVLYHPIQVNDDLLRCVRAYDDPTLIIAPKEWKCRNCPQVHKELCQYEKKNQNADAK